MSVWWRAWWGKKRKTEVFTASMNFGLGEDIDALRDMVSRFAADRIVPVAEHVREVLREREPAQEHDRVLAQGREHPVLGRERGVEARVGEELAARHRRTIAAWPARSGQDAPRIG